jgi:glucose/arabinose dehydrogenase
MNKAAYTLIMLMLTGAISLNAPLAQAQTKNPTEADYYPLVSIPIPEGIVLEGGGLELMPDGKLAISTRRGDIFMVENPFAKQDQVDKIKFTKWAGGLHEVLGLSLHDGWLYATQRCEVTKIKDRDGDGRADLFLTVTDDWEISGDYHEYTFGSKFDPDNKMWLVLCLTGSFSSKVPYRGWCVRVTPDGKMIPTASGIRSPGGIGLNSKGEAFYCDNQGPWNGTSSLKHLTPGSFQGHPGGFKWYDLPAVKAAMGPKPAEPKDKSRFHVEFKKLPKYRPPPVLIPHGSMGNSASGIAADNTNGKFGPFKDQLFVSDQSHSIVNRVYLEKIKGYYQGAVFPFRKGFGSGNVPMLMTKDGSIFVSGTARGWGARGGKPFALDRLYWNGKVPFEVLEMHIQKDGFELVFTKPVDKTTAGDAKSYKLQTYTYIFQAQYGSPVVDKKDATVKSATVSADGLRVKLVVDGLQIGSIHELKMAGVRSAKQSLPLLHDVGYYTLWQMP